MNRASFLTSLAAAAGFAAACLSAGAASAGSPGEAGAHDHLRVALNMAKPVKLDAPIATIIMGNPAIADFSLRDDQFMFVTGRSVGSTNLIAYDADGEMVANYVVQVTQAQGATVTVRRGVERENYECAPRCTRTLSLDDAGATQGEYRKVVSEQLRLEATAAGIAQKAEGDAAKEELEAQQTLQTGGAQ